jgi:hypothetical protein
LLFTVIGSVSEPSWGITLHEAPVLYLCKIFTETTLPSTLPNDRRTVGVCEIVICKIDPAPSGTVTWAATNNAWLSDTSGAEIEYTAADTPIDATITATLQFGESDSVDFDVVGPTPLIEFWESLMVEQFGVGAVGKVYLQPDTVNFGRIKGREKACPAEDVWGFFEGVAPEHDPGPGEWWGAGVVAGKGTWVGYDTVAAFGWGPDPSTGSYAPGGGLTYNIPWEYRQITQPAGWRPMGIVPQVFTMLQVSDDQFTFVITKSDLTTPPSAYP